MRIAWVACVLLGLVGSVAAEPLGPGEARLRPQLHADLGLSVVLLGYERPVTPHVAIGAGAGIFGTYFLPWFDAGQDVKGLGLGVRVTWTPRDGGRGFYVAPYARGVGVRGDKDGATGTGVGFTAGVFAGWVFGLTRRLDLRLGGGAQYIRFSYDTDAGRARTSTPFAAIDILLGYRL